MPISDNLKKRYEEAAKLLPELEQQIKDAKDTIDFQREIGRDVTGLEANLQNDISQVNKIKTALKRRGIEV